MKSNVIYFMLKIKSPFVKHDKKHPKFEYDQIDDNIYIGTNMCCVTHFDGVLIKKGIRMDISLEEEKLDAPFGVEFFRWLPTKDHTPPKQDQLKLGTSLIADIVGQDKKVYIHCKNGHGRAPTLVSAYYISTGLSVEDAIKKIQTKRKTIHLDKNQITALEKFSKNYKS